MQEQCPWLETTKREGTYGCMWYENMCFSLWRCSNQWATHGVCGEAVGSGHKSSVKIRKLQQDSKFVTQSFSDTEFQRWQLKSQMLPRPPANDNSGNNKKKSHWAKIKKEKRENTEHSLKHRCEKWRTRHCRRSTGSPSVGTTHSPVLILGTSHGCLAAITGGARKRPVWRPAVWGVLVVDLGSRFACTSPTAAPRGPRGTRTAVCGGPQFEKSLSC